MEYVTVRLDARIELDREVRRYEDEAPSEDQIMRVIDQCLADAVDGTFGALRQRAGSPPDSLKARLNAGPMIGEPSGGARRVEFSFGLPAEMFPVAVGGFQHLIGILAGEAFPDQVGNCRVKNPRVNAIDIPEGMTTAAMSSFHRGDRHIEDIRSAFKISDPLEPLIAFSFKPRLGFDTHYAEQVTRDVVDAGVRLVEFDTRNLEDPARAFPQWVRLARIAFEVADSKKRVATFAPNLSHSAPLAVELASRWCSDDGVGKPRVVKVDGGFEGLSTLQGIRRQLSQEPIVTTYPLLRSAVKSYVGSADLWIDLLALSGADIIYPGNRPTFNEARNVGGDDTRGLYLSAERYKKYLLQRWPMPTFAAGAHPGHLHVVYELLGPDVAYFLGGAIALHPKGPGAGARLCVRILDIARENAQKARTRGDLCGEDLPSKLIEEIEGYKPNGREVWYKSPRAVFGSGLEPFDRC